jgi:hypothetical protein
MLRYAGFFWIQGLCVILEVLVNLAIRHAGAPVARPLWLNSRKSVRFVWTVRAMYATLQMIVGELVEMSVKMGRRTILLFSAPQNLEL